MKQYNKMIILISLFFLIFNFVSFDYALAVSNNDNGSSTEAEIQGGIIMGIGFLTYLLMQYSPKADTDSSYVVMSKKKSTNYSSHLNKGKEYLKQDEFNLAIEELNKARGIKDSERIRNLLAKAHLNRGEFYYKINNYDQAFYSLEKAKKIENNLEIKELLTKVEPKYKKLHYQQGVDYLENENWFLAYKELNKVKRIDDNYKKINIKYEQAYQKSKQLRLKRIAVPRFEGDYGANTSSFVTAGLLAKDPKFIEVIERRELNQVLAEQRMSVTGLIDRSTAQEVGNILGVDYLIVGKVLGLDVEADRSTVRSSEYSTTYSYRKEAYAQVLFKLLDVTNGSIVMSKILSQNWVYSLEYSDDEAVVHPSDEEMLNDALENISQDFTEIIYNRPGGF